MNENISEDQLQELYAWIDQVPLSRPKKNIARDFSDGVLVAEVTKHFFPKIVEIHNYISANSTQHKLSNWATLNRKVFSKLNLHVPDDIIRKLIANTPGVIETILYTLRQKINERLQDKNQRENITQQESEYFSTHTGQPTYGSTNVSSPTYQRTLPHVGPTDQTHSHPKRYDISMAMFILQYSFLPLLSEFAVHSQLRVGCQDTLHIPGSPVDAGTEWTSSRTSQAKWWKIKSRKRRRKKMAAFTIERGQILQMKVQRLEHLVQLKDLRIEDLTRHLNKQRLQKNIT
ncbi:sperm flagellar protein 1-like [Pyxicephalus adspersus]|uniref:sperm flagellar protein 1-like n=1 Tax=Pyxicephalus adspersus TaxID=30357 RepID=UPI003B5C46CF